MELGIGKRIRQRRTELGLSQKELAHKMGYKSEAAICKVENGEDNITTDRVSKFAKALDCTPAHLMGWDTSKTPSSSDEQLHATKLYEQYQKASPEIRNAVDLLLKGSEQ